MLKLLSYVFLTITLSSCVTKPPTQYGKFENNQGLKIIKLQGTKKVPIYKNASIFMANSQTNSKRAYLYSRLGAIDYCSKTNMEAFLGDTINNSKEAKYISTQTTRSTIPGYSKYKGKTYRNYNKDFHTQYTKSYPTTIKYPQFITPFLCISNFKRFEDNVSFENLSKELVSPYTKDFKGGILLKDINDKQKTKDFKDGDVLISVDGTRVETGNELYEKIFLTKISKNQAKVRVIRDQKIMNISVEFKNDLKLIKFKNLKDAALACEIETENEIVYCKDSPKEQLTNMLMNLGKK